MAFRFLFLRWFPMGRVEVPSALSQSFESNECHGSQSSNGPDVIFIDAQELDKLGKRVESSNENE